MFAHDCKDFIMLEILLYLTSADIFVVYLFPNYGIYSSDFNVL